MFLAVVVISVASCDSRPNTSVPKQPAEKPVVKGIDLDERINSTDSVVVVFYDDPYTADSSKYTRFYKQYGTTSGTEIIRPLLNNLELPFTKLEKVKACRSEGKLWLYAKGKIFQTIYFTFTKSSCAFIYLIKDGFFFYMDIQQSFSDQLRAIQKLVKAPATM